MNKIDKRTDPRGGEPPDAMSLRYADIEPPRFASHTEPLLCTKRASTNRGNPRTP